MGSLEVSDREKKWPNLNACSKSNNWDEFEFIPNETSVIMGQGHSSHWFEHMHNWSSYMSPKFPKFPNFAPDYTLRQKKQTLNLA